MSVFKLEGADQFDQALCLFVQAARCGGALLDQCRVLLRHIAQLQHGVIDLRDTGSLLRGRSADFADQVGDLLHIGHDAFHRFAGRVHELAAVVDLLNAVVDQNLDVLSGRRTLLGEAADFTGHDRKAATLLAGTSGFHRCVQRQNVGLEGDAVDHRNDVHDALGRFRDASHGGDHVLDDFAAVLGGAAGGHRALSSLASHIGVALHGAGQLFHRGSGFGQISGLLFRTLREVGVTGCDLACAAGDALTAGTHFAHQATQCRLHGSHVGHDAVGRHVFLDAPGQVALGDRTCDIGHFIGFTAQLAQNGAREQETK